MVKYASEELDRQTLAKVQQQLSRTLSDCSEERVHTLLDALLGPEEYAALAKRLTAILLLLQGRSASATARVLKMSRAHVAKLAYRLQAGEFTAIAEQYTDIPAGWNDVAEFTETVLRMGGIMPLYGERVGSGNHTRYHDKYQKEREARRVFRSDKTTDINDL